MTSSKNESVLPANACFENNLREKYSALRFKQAIALLNHHGFEIGLSRLREVDPDVAANVKSFLQKQQDK